MKIQCLVCILIFIATLLGCRDEVVIRKRQRIFVQAPAPQRAENVPVTIVPPKVVVERYGDTKNTTIIQGGGFAEGGVEGGGRRPSVDTADSGKRKVYFDITADFPLGKVRPDLILVDSLETRSGDMVATGSHAFKITKKGYETLTGDFLVTEADKSKTVERQLIAKPRVVKFAITAGGQKINPDKVLISGREIKDGGKVKPGDHKYSIFKKGFDSINGYPFIITPSEKPYYLRRDLGSKAIPTVIRWEIETEYPAGEPIEVPETVLLDGKEIEYENQVEPGEHKITIMHPGHHPLTKNVTISKDPVYTFKGVLRTLPRQVNITVTYDAEPPDSLGATQMALIPEETGVAMSVKSGVKIKPGTYFFQAKKEAYQDFKIRKRIFPASSPYEIKSKLISKPVVIKANISFDISPPNNLAAHVITFIAKDTGIRQQVKPGGSIKPGSYFYIVEKPGYEMKGGQKDITIFPSESPFLIKENMAASPRQISFSAVVNGVQVETKEFLIDNQVSSFDKRYKPGRRYHLIAKFRNYRTVEKDVLVPPGPGVYVVSVPLAPK